MEVIIVESESDDQNDQNNHSNDSCHANDSEYNPQSTKCSNNPSDPAPEPDINLESITDIYLIDLENKPAFKLNTNPNRIYIGFISSIHHAIPKYNRWHKAKSDNISYEVTKSNNLKLLYTIDSSTTDVVDHFLTVFCYPVINFVQQHNLKGSIRIISGDHAAYCTRDCLIKIMKWKGIEGIKIKNAGYIR